MHKTRLNPFLRLTALGVSLSLFGLTLAPLAHAQAADPKAKATEAPSPKPASPAPPPAAPAKPASSMPASKPADITGSEATPAAAQPDKKTRDAARKAYAQGEKSFAAGDYFGAYDAFEKANLLIPAPHAEYWMAKSLDKQDKSMEAAAAYEKFLAGPDASRVGDEKLTDAKSRLAELKMKLVAQIDVVTVPAGAVVLVDGNPEPGVTPLSLKLPAGPHKLTISANGYETRDIDIEAKAGDKSEQKIQLVVKPPPAPVAPPAPEPYVAPVTPTPVPKRSMVPAFVTLGIAAAGATVGTVFGLQALSAKSDFNDNPSTEAADDAERNALISDMAFGVAITLGVTGIVLLTSGDEAPPETAKKTPFNFELGARAGKDSGSASARFTF